MKYVKFAMILLKEPKHMYVMNVHWYYVIIVQTESFSEISKDKFILIY